MKKKNTETTGKFIYNKSGWLRCTVNRIFVANFGTFNNTFAYYKPVVFVAIFCFRFSHVLFYFIGPSKVNTELHCTQYSIQYTENCIHKFK